MGWGAVYGYIFTPIFLQYLIRANHEHPLNLAVLAGFYGFVRCEKSWRYKALFIIALIFAVFTKGMNAVVLTILALMYWLLFMRSSRSFLFLVMANFLTLGFISLFEIWYQQVTEGVGFWQNYISFQGGLALKAGFNPLRKIYNFIWYLGRAIWFPAPWVFFVFFGFYKSIKGKISLAENKFFKICLINATLIIFWFSLFDRKADRYIFSAYCFLALAGVWILLRLKPKFMHFFQKREKLLPVYLSIILIVLTLLRIYFHSYHYKFIRFWSG
jgi:4-amino-4-deoxy-L-arabinose transferase